MPFGGVHSTMHAHSDLANGSLPHATSLDTSTLSVIARGLPYTSFFYLFHQRHKLCRRAKESCEGKKSLPTNSDHTVEVSIIPYVKSES